MTRTTESSISDNLRPFTYALIFSIILLLAGCSGGGGGGTSPPDNSTPGSDTSNGDTSGSTNGDVQGDATDGGTPGDDTTTDTVDTGSDEQPVSQIGEWIDMMSPMPSERSRVQTAVVNGLIYVLGGNDGTSPVATVEAYDPETNTWITGLADMPIKRRYFEAVTLGGIIYVMGGQFEDAEKTMDAYDPATDTWTPKAGMHQARTDLVGCTIDGKIYVAGGWDTRTSGSGWATDYLSSAEVYDPATDTWSWISAMPLHKEDAAGVVLKGRWYILGGYSVGGGGINNSVFSYNPETDSWSEANPMLFKRSYAGAVVVNEKIFAIGGNGGADGDDSPYRNLDSLEIFDTATGQWTLGDYPAKTYSGGCAEILDGIVYLMNDAPDGAVSAMVP